MLRRISRMLLVPLGVLPALLVAAAAVYATGGQVGGAAPAPPPPAEGAPVPGELAPAPPAPVYESIVWRRSRALGKPFAGRLVNGVRLPAEGSDFFTWDPVLKRTPNRSWRRWGTARLLRITLRVLREHRAAFPGAPRIGIGDISRRSGGDFGTRFGGIGHGSHQNGLDVDIYYPRLDGFELRAARVSQIDLELAQDLVDRFVAAGAQYVFVGPKTGLTGPRKIVSRLVHHDDHAHVRIPPRRDR